MFRRAISSKLQTLVSSSSSHSSASTFASAKCASLISSRSTRTPLHRSSCLLTRHFSVECEVSRPNKRVEDVMPIATGHEREELEAELEGRDILEINHPVGPFGTKEEPAVVKSYFDKRIVGCPGGEGEDEHDVVWFWLEKGKPHECPVCTQYFVLDVVGPGGPPDGHGDDEDH